ncbi:hypothetical protein ZYGR_0AG06230 [Zygosaccharomyces rouxii]|uniref:Zn(2)-C6 fungal-type domain-containing protein n=1 Tax=Zygosaccharomyces rouxii TaxID=4956 RepID=A0A1Q3AAB1_ZYGRO|nr:hypothetical protein ZYGR_0AG06230 [Zygosaccharomyces rouxii]
MSSSGEGGLSGTLLPAFSGSGGGIGGGNKDNTNNASNDNNNNNNGMHSRDADGAATSVNEEGIIVGDSGQPGRVNVRACTLIKGAAADDPRILEATQMETSEGGKLKRNSFACISCHSLKQKCVPSDINDIYRKPCIRCLKNGKLCRFDLSKRTRKRKRRGSPISSPSIGSPKLDIRDGHDVSGAFKRENPISTSAISVGSNNNPMYRRPYSHEVLQNDQHPMSETWSSQSHTPTPMGTPLTFNPSSGSTTAAAASIAAASAASGYSGGYQGGFPGGFTSGYPSVIPSGYPSSYPSSYAGGVPTMLNANGTPTVSMPGVLFGSHNLPEIPGNMTSTMSVQDPNSVTNANLVRPSANNNTADGNGSTGVSSNVGNAVTTNGSNVNNNADGSTTGSGHGSPPNPSGADEKRGITGRDPTLNHKGSHSLFKGQLHDLLTYQKDKIGQISSTLNSLSKQWDTLIQSSMSITSSSDPVSLAIILPEEAESRLQIFLKDVVPKVNLPFISLLPDTKADQLRRNKPILFSTIMSCVSGMMTHENSTKETNMKLDSFLLDLITDQIFKANNKSIELIESLLTLCFWYNFPEWAHKARYHIFNYVCVCLTKEMGPTFAHRAFGIFLEDDPGSSQYPLTAPLEQYTNGSRLILLVYISSLNISIFLRQSIKARWSSTTEQACSKICERMSSENNGNYDDDKTLVVFARLNHILERIHINLHENGSTDLARTEEYESTQKHLDCLVSAFKYDLSELFKEIPQNRHRVIAYFYSVEAYLYQYIIDSYIERMPTKLSIGPLPANISDAFLRCYDFCARTLREFVKLTPRLVASLPLFHSSRIIYTVGMLLLKLRYSAIALPAFQQFQHATKDAIILVSEVSKLLEESSNIFIFNNFLYKLRYVVALFVQTYGNKVKALFSLPDARRSSTANETKFDENSRNLTAVPTEVPTKATTHTKTTTGTMEPPNNLPDPGNVILNAAYPAFANTDMMPPTQTTNAQDFDSHIGFQSAPPHDKVNSNSPDVPPSSATSSGNINDYLTDVDSIILGFNALNDEFWTDIFSNDL